jgi:hypothetical protein
MTDDGVVQLVDMKSGLVSLSLADIPHLTERPWLVIAERRPVICTSLREVNLSRTAFETRGVKAFMAFGGLELVNLCLTLVDADKTQKVAAMYFPGVKVRVQERPVVLRPAPRIDDAEENEDMNMD